MMVAGFCFVSRIKQAKADEVIAESGGPQYDRIVEPVDEYTTWIWTRLL